MLEFMRKNTGRQGGVECDTILAQTKELRSFFERENFIGSDRIGIHCRMGRTGSVRLSAERRKNVEKEQEKIVREMIKRQRIGAVLAENGISEEEFIRWLEDGEAAAYLYRMAKVKAMAKVPELWLKLEQMAADGDLKAMKLYCDLCERSQGAEQAAGIPDNPDVAAVRDEIFGDGALRAEDHESE